MTQYNGLCIGGPMAGQVIVKDLQRFEVMEKSVKTHTYNWHHTGAFGLWIHDSLNLHSTQSHQTAVPNRSCQTASQSPTSRPLSHHLCPI